MARRVRGFVLTIDSDDDEANIEIQVPDTKSKLAVKNSLVWKEDAIVAKEDAIVSKVEDTVDQQLVAPQFSENFLFEDPDQVESVGGDDHTVIESWDFTKTIADMKSKEHPAQKLTTSLDHKIQLTLQKRAEERLNDEPVKEEDSESDSEDEADEVVNGGRKVLTTKTPEESKDESREMGINSTTLQKQKLLLKAQEDAQAKIPLATFVELNLSRSLMRAVTTLGFERPTPIQAKAIPFAMAGRDICGSAVTGSGKTAAYLLPILERLLFRPKRVLATRVLIVTPTRELAQQVQSMLEKLGQFTDIKSISIVGGLSLRDQANELRARPDVVVATPGRLIDHVRNSQSVDLDNVEILVLDEADRLLELGFQEEVMELVKFCPRGRQTMLFSATMTTSVNQLVDLSLNRPVRIEADPLYDMANRLTQEFVRIRPNREDDREAMLMSLVTRSLKNHAIIFFRRKFETHRMGIIFGLMGLKAAELHGNLTQTQRLESLQKFRDNKVDFLLCTDLASRGIDIVGVENVINFEMPKDLSTYVHRVGRTARAGRGGRAVTLTSEKQRMLTKEVLKKSKHNVKSRTIPEKVIEDMKDRILDLEQDIEHVIQQEKAEKAMRLAEMEVNKASNLIEHHSEIMAKPARTWFQSAKEKEATKQASKNAADGIVVAPKKEKEAKDPNDKKHRLTRKKRRRLEAEKSELQFKREREEQLRSEAEERGENLNESTLKHLKVPLTTKNAIASRLSKKKSRESKDAEDRVAISGEAPVKKNRRNAAASVADIRASADLQTTTLNKRARFGGMELAGFEAEVVSGQGLSMLDKRAKTRKGDTEELVFKERDLSKGGLRKGGKLGSGAFKSKAKYKRR